jgi:hypothetical protein
MTRIVCSIFCLLVIISCKKDKTIKQPIENSNQLLSKLTKTTYLSSGAYIEFIDYEYNNAGKLIREGAKNLYPR